MWNCASGDSVRTPDVSREGCSTYELSTSFFIFINPPRSTATQWMVMKCIPEVRSIGKASTIEISPTAPSFSEGSKSAKFGRRFQRYSKFIRPHLKMQQAIRTPTQTSCVVMIALCPRQAWWSWVNARLRTVVQKCPPPKIAQRKCGKSRITQTWIVLFRSNFAQRLNTPHVLQ